MSRLLILGILVLSGCATGPTTEPNTSALLPRQIAIPTAEPPNGEPSCRLRLNSGTLVADDAAGVAVEVSAGLTAVVVWPHGWWAEDRDGLRVLLDADGDLVATEGDQIKYGGAEGTDGRVRACAEITRIP